MSKNDFFNKSGKYASSDFASSASSTPIAKRSSSHRPNKYSAEQQQAEHQKKERGGTAASFSGHNSKHELLGHKKKPPYTNFLSNT